MKTIKVPKNSTISEIISMEYKPFISYQNSNGIKKIEDNSKGSKGSPDYFVHLKNGDIDELYSMAIIKIPFTEFNKKIQLL